ncbi:unnamed protein product [Mytilus edulis]|uniref:Uncharacterized protein n=1 Tax=Mytilus edulis TaxID=6550 RepID=A0A8S3RVU7_MYTED|nr:unnamed protein product [Mytilus edulis]
MIDGLAFPVIADLSNGVHLLRTLCPDDPPEASLDYFDATHASGNIRRNAAPGQCLCILMRQTSAMCPPTIWNVHDATEVLKYVLCVSNTDKFISEDSIFTKKEKKHILKAKGNVRRLLKPIMVDVGVQGSTTATPDGSQYTIDRPQLLSDDFSTQPLDTAFVGSPQKDRMHPMSPSRHHHLVLKPDSDNSYVPSDESHRSINQPLQTPTLNNQH